MKLRVANLVAGCGLALGANACFFESSADPGPPPPVVQQEGASQLTVRWTVDEANDVNLCNMGGTSDIDIVVTTTTGESRGEFQAPCQSFSTTISTLPPGNYQATARLIDINGASHTTPVSMQPFTLAPDSNLVVDIDFPADSFL